MTRSRERRDATERSVGLTECRGHTAHCAGAVRRGPTSRARPRPGAPWPRSTPTPPRRPPAAAVPARPRDGLRLVIVESPTKARTISGYLGDGYVVESSIGHIRDLPRNAADVPAKYKGESWARLGVDVDNGFEPLYVVSPDRRQQVTKLRDLLKSATELYLATDEDREGEAIAWHLVETLKPRVPIRRMVFHEITPEAIRRAVENTARDRRATWSTPRRPGASSTGSTATRSARCCGRRSCRSCRRAACSRWRPGSWSSASGPGCASAPPTTGTSRARSPPASRPPTATRPPSPRPWSASTTTGSPPAGTSTRRPGRTRGDVVHLDEPGARGLAARLDGSRLHRQPGRGEAVPAPSVRAVHDQHAAAGGRAQAALLHRADHAHGAAAVRERLHHLHADRLDEPVRDGADRGPAAGARAVRRRVRAAGAPALRAQGQERAGGARGDPPGGRHLPHAGGGGRRAVHRRVPALRADLAAHARLADGRRGRHQRLGPARRHQQHRRARRVLGERQDDHLPRLPPGVRGEPGRGLRRRRPRRQRAAAAAAAAGPAARPAGAGAAGPHHRRRRPATPSRAWSRRWRSSGIGRPSTYASIMQTIQDRGYVWKKGSALVPSWIAFAVVNLLEQHFARLVDYGFTASVEEDLDEHRRRRHAVGRLADPVLLRLGPAATRAASPGPAA